MSRRCSQRNNPTISPHVSVDPSIPVGHLMSFWGLTLKYEGIIVMKASNLKDFGH